MVLKDLGAGASSSDTGTSKVSLGRAAGVWDRDRDLGRTGFSFEGVGGRGGRRVVGAALVKVDRGSSVWRSGVCDLRDIEVKPYSGILLLAALPYVVIFFRGTAASWKVAIVPDLEYERSKVVGRESISKRESQVSLNRVNVWDGCASSESDHAVFMKEGTCSRNVGGGR